MGAERGKERERERGEGAWAWARRLRFVGGFYPSVPHPRLPRRRAVHLIIKRTILRDYPRSLPKPERS